MSANETVPRLRPNLPELPARIARLPVDARGFPVPFFVAWIDGVPDHRIKDGRKQVLCVRERLCWVCGEPLGAYLAFLIGCMCAVNRVSSEPPSHRECAEFSARACPFLSTPHQRRREKGVPDKTQWSETGLKRNPGVALVWVTKSFKVIRGAGTEVLFQIGDPTETLWFCEGRPATRDEVLHSVETGLPLLREFAVKDGPRAIEHLDRLAKAAEQHYPAV